MPTIRDVAALAGVSISTVSIVINGQAEERQVAKETALKVSEAVKTLGYKPNNVARRLRSADEGKPVIALYWPLDYRASFLARILVGLQNEVKRRSLNVDLVVCTYTNDYLYKEIGLTNKNRYNIAIIGAASAKDMDFLASSKSKIPVILFNRYLESFHTVRSNDEASAFEAASIFAKKGHKRVAVITTEGSAIATSFRTQSFLNACRELKMDIDPSMVIKAEHSYEGGANAARKLIRRGNLPKALFCDSDVLAIGAAKIFNQEKINIPDELEMISFGLLGADTTEYMTPSITVVSIPSEEMASESIAIAESILNDTAKEPIHAVKEPQILYRDSCRI
ncbi:LacI family DNA-binding transcriptional regulator [Youngiibacter multivorans]|uniref:LacI family purine nucleotide synthesis repressor n=1 Tax=Youngiibacter multivorans TaxID=937251 RepID=A0ABS4G121_9CLOT|nr:LacI family DNA-binding transcriptional regulator [Youngiibacter multivorans]MBP1918236.1 LacI family purine nucleotide synthesis repressor [Youngiibacter multivorans]